MSARAARKPTSALSMDLNCTSSSAYDFMLNNVSDAPRLTEKVLPGLEFTEPLREKELETDTPGNGRFWLLAA